MEFISRNQDFGATSELFVRIRRVHQTSTRGHLAQLTQTCYLTSCCRFPSSHPSATNLLQSCTIKISSKILTLGLPKCLIPWSFACDTIQARIVLNLDHGYMVESKTTVPTFIIWMGGMQKVPDSSRETITTSNGTMARTLQLATYDSPVCGFDDDVEKNICNGFLYKRSGIVFQRPERKVE